MAKFELSLESFKTNCRTNWGWVVVCCAFCNFVTMFGLLYSYGVLFVALQKEFNSTATITSWIGSIAIGLHTLGSFISNPLITKLKHRTVAYIGLLMCFTACISSSLMPKISFLFLTFSVLYGLGVNFVLISSMSLILKYFPGSNCSRATSVALVGTTAGMLVMNPLVQMIIEAYGWRNMLRIVGASILLIGIPSCSTYSQPLPFEQAPQVMGLDEKGRPQISTTVASQAMEQSPEDSNRELDRTTLENAKNARDHGPGSTSTRKVSFADDTINNTDEIMRLLRQNGAAIPEDGNEGDDEVMTPPGDVAINESESDLNPTENRHILYKLKGTLVWKILMVMKLPELWFLSIALMGCAMTMSFYYISLVNFMKILGFSGTQTSLIMSIVAFSEVVGKILLSIFADHLPFDKIYLFVISSFLGIGIMFSLLFFVKNFMSMVAISIVMGCIVMTVLDALPYSICNQVFGKKRRVEAWTVLLCANGIGLILGSLYGESVDKTGSYNDALYLSIGFYSISIVLFLMVPLYQTCCTKRLIMKKDKKRKITLADEWGVGRSLPYDSRRDSFLPSPLPVEECIQVQRESCV